MSHTETIQGTTGSYQTDSFLVLLYATFNHSDGVCSFCFFVDELKKLPAPEVAVKYYTGGDFYLFGKFVILQAFVLSSKMLLGFDTSSTFYADEFQSARAPNSRRPKIGNVKI